MPISNVLKTISARLGRTPLTAETLEKRFAQLKDSAPPPVVQPVGDLLAIFMAQARKNLFDVSEASQRDEMVHSLQTAVLPIVLSSQESVRAINWNPVAAQLTTDFHAPALGVVEAVAAIAETGTLAVRSVDVPSGLLFLCEELVIILRQSTIVPFQEDLWRQLAPGHYRALHLISGPSRTADVEQTLQVGAHGPRRVCLWLVED